MVLQKVEGYRSQVTEELQGLKISIPAKRNIFIFVFLVIWLAGWAIGETRVSLSLFSSKQPLHGQMFSIVWLLGWTIAGIVTMYIWLWNAFGKEIILIDGYILSIKRDLFGFGQPKEYELSQIRTLRISPMVYNPSDFNSGLQFWGVGGGAIAFDYGSKTIRAGSSIDESEATYLVNRIKSTYKI